MFRKRVLEIKIKERSPDIDPLVRPFLLFRVQNAAELAASSAGTKVCSAGCGRAKQRADFSKKQWAGRAVRRCLDCVENRVEPKICAHGKGAFDCAACCEIVKHEAEAEAAAANKISTEQYHADKKYDEAVTVAAKTCAEYVKGQTCYICTEAFHWETKEGLVKMCACPGTAGFVHVSCLAEQARRLVAEAEEEAEESNLGAEVWNERWSLWHTCGLCGQEYHGVVAHALGLACRKTYLGQPEGSWARRMAMTLGNGSGDFDPTDTDGPRLEGVPTGKFCANCGRGNASKTCGRCMAQAYCSTECQRADWKRHKASCQSVEGLEASADAPEVEKDPSRSGLEKSDLFQAIHKAVIASADSPSLRLVDSPVFLEFTKAVAAHTQYALNADRGNLMQRLAHDILVHTPEQQMLDTIKAAGWVPSEERALFLKQYRFILELRANSEQVTKSKQEMDKVKKIMAQYLASENRETKNSWVKKLVEDAGRAYERHRRQNQRVERRKCDVCERQDLTSAPRFMMCAGCGKRRYCSGICQEKDWRENGHKMTCAPISDFACRVTGGCPVSERGYCDFCAETFCLDCEDDLRRCDDCGLYSCGSQEAHEFGPIDRICPRIWGCEACGKYYCPRCQVVETCVICDMDFCDFCGSNCSICNDPICDKCCDAREAKGLANLCAQCGDASGWELVDGRWVKRPRADDPAHDALADRVGALEAKP